jgi:oligoendopeptidase F
LNLFDIVAPIDAKEIAVEWDEGVDLILKTVSNFSPKFGKIVSEFFTKQRVDAPPGEGKVGGAFSYSVGPNMPSYVLLNWNGTGRDLATLAHELGHGVHGILSGAQTPLNFHPPLVLAEVASTFFEFLLHDRLREEKPELASIPEKLEEVIATVFRQNAFYNFEKKAHREISTKGAQSERLSETFIETYAREVFQGAVEYPEDYRVEWAAIPHFVHTPFYVYAYTLAELVSLLIFKRYKEGMKDFEARYTELLQAGGSEDPETLLRKTMAIDIARGETWEEALEFIEEYFLKPILK